MGYNQSLNDLDQNAVVTKTQLAILAIVLCLAVDALNPVKIFLHVFPQIAPWQIATLCVTIMVYIFISEMKTLLYFTVKVFFHSILSIFFKDVEVVGLQNVPRYGPVIFTGNHANQFIDGVTILCTCQRTISYLVAEKSWNRPVIGHLSWALGTVPVKRAQDSAKPGSGKLVLSDQSKGEIQGPEEEGESTKDIVEVRGEGTAFRTEVRPKYKIRLEGNPTPLTVVEIESDTALKIEMPKGFARPFRPVSYDVFERVDQSQVYTAVLDKLSGGGCIGIFPEGGSHDRTDLLPLKVGVSLIAYSALERDGVNIPIVPVGLNYFHAHRFRGRAIVEFGAPIYVDPTTLDGYKKGGSEKRQVCNDLLLRIEDSMRSVLVTVPDYQTLQLVNTARRLYQRRELSTSQKQDLNRRFAEGYKRLLFQTKGNPPPEWQDIQDRIVWYQKELSELGLRDYQVPGLRREHYYVNGDTALREMRLPYRIITLLFSIALAFLPALFLNLPVGLVASIYAEARRKKALAGSKVKIKGFDVILSEKVVLCIVLVPSLWFLYGVLLYFFTNMDGPALVLAVGSMPLFSYVGIMMTETGMIHLKDLRPYLMRLLPSTRRRLKVLPGIRKQLQDDLREFIKMVGPTLGELYYEKELDWKEIQVKSRMMYGDAGITSSKTKDKKVE